MRVALESMKGGESRAVYPSPHPSTDSPFVLIQSQLRYLCQCCIVYSGVETYRDRVGALRSGSYGFETFVGNGFSMC